MKIRINGKRIRVKLLPPKSKSSAYRKRKRFQRKAQLIRMLGGRCADCGWGFGDFMYDFHHVDPSKREFSISGANLELSLKRLVTEVKKCVLLCPNCHRVRHAKMEGQIC